jgi:hypothetical protein
MHCVALVALVALLYACRCAALCAASTAGYPSGGCNLLQEVSSNWVPCVLLVLLYMFAGVRHLCWQRS